MVQFATNNSRLQGIKNTKFILGHDLSPLENKSQNVIYVNNVLNLLDDKISFLQTPYEKLKSKELLIIADEFALEDIPTDLRKDESFQCGGISGAEFIEGMESISIRAGFKILNWESIKEYNIEIKNKKYNLKTAILILEKN